MLVRQKRACTTFSAGWQHKHASGVVVLLKQTKKAPRPLPSKRKRACETGLGEIHWGGLGLSGDRFFSGCHPFYRLSPITTLKRHVIDPLTKYISGLAHHLGPLEAPHLLLVRHPLTLFVPVLLAPRLFLTRPCDALLLPLLRLKEPARRSGVGLG